MTGSTSKQNISILKDVMVTFIPCFHHNIFFFPLISIRRPVPVPFVGVTAEPFIKRKELRKLPAATKLYVKKRFLSSEARLFSVFFEKNNRQLSHQFPYQFISMTCNLFLFNANVNWLPGYAGLYGYSREPVL